MAARAEAAELDALGVRNLLGVAVTPLHGHVRIGIGVHEHVERAGSVELGQECHGRGDLSEYRLDLSLDLDVGFIGLRGGGAGGEEGWISWGGFGRGGEWIGGFYVGAEFSLSAGFCAVGFLPGLLKIWTF